MALLVLHCQGTHCNCQWCHRVCHVTKYTSSSSLCSLFFPLFLTQSHLTVKYCTLYSIACVTALGITNLILVLQDEYHGLRRLNMRIWATTLEFVIDPHYIESIMNVDLRLENMMSLRFRLASAQEALSRGHHVSLKAVQTQILRTC